MTYPNTTPQGRNTPSTKDFLAWELRGDFESEPLEDGMNHRAEQTIERAAHNIPEQDLLPMLEELATDPAQPSVSSGILRCMGTLADLGNPVWKQRVIARALQQDDVEIRDAAVQAAEGWGNPELADTLRAHKEPEPWIRQYIEEVISDLTE